MQCPTNSCYGKFKVTFIIKVMGTKVYYMEEPRLRNGPSEDMKPFLTKVRSIKKRENRYL